MFIKKYLPQFIYGSIDGMITTFAVVSGIVGASLSSSIILVLGLANVLADGFSMASSNYLSERSKHISVKNSLKTSLATFIAFITLGLIPILPYLTLSRISNENAFKISIILTATTFFLIGYIKGKITGKSKIRGGLETLLVGSLAAFIAFIVGYLLRDLV